MEALKGLLVIIAPAVNPQAFLGLWAVISLGVCCFGDCAVRHPLALAVTCGVSFPTKDLYPTLMPNKRTQFCVRYGILFSIRAVGSSCELLL